MAKLSLVAVEEPLKPSASRAILCRSSGSGVNSFCCCVLCFLVCSAVVAIVLVLVVAAAVVNPAATADRYVWPLPFLLLLWFRVCCYLFFPFSFPLDSSLMLILAWLDDCMLLVAAAAQLLLLSSL